ncbi:hypothetical protein GmHk_13G037405 [Glycine max]|nr:hypothetical protein GmHk_13G037405 [Glycine max]
MEPEGQKGTVNPSAMLASLLSRRAKLHEDLRSIEKQGLRDDLIFVHACVQFLKRSRKFQPEDRLFSLSSVTSPAAEDLAAGRDDGRPDYGPGRSKGGGIYANGQGKPKKGRGGARDAKRARASSEQDFDYEDDPDLTL